jgi:hypothetical protein
VILKKFRIPAPAPAPAPVQRRLKLMSIVFLILLFVLCSQPDYLRKISLKMLSMETKTQPGLNAPLSNQNRIDPGINEISSFAHTFKISCFLFSL